MRGEGVGMGEVRGAVADFSLVVVAGAEERLKSAGKWEEPLGESNTKAEDRHADKEREGGKTPHQMHTSTDLRRAIVIVAHAREDDWACQKKGSLLCGQSSSFPVPPQPQSM